MSEEEGRGKKEEGRRKKEDFINLPVSPSPRLPVSPSPRLPVSPSPHLSLALEVNFGINLGKSHAVVDSPAVEVVADLAFL